MEFKDYYKTLGLKKDSDEKSIKDAFKKLAKKLHPDTEGGSEDKFKEINEAYEVLRDKDKRSRYDYLYANMQNAKTNSTETKTQSYKQQKMYSNYNSFADFYKQKEQELRERQAKERTNPYTDSTNKQKSDESFSDFFEMFFGKHKEKSKTESKPQQEQSQNSSKSIRGADFEMEIELSLEDAYHGCIRKIEITNSANQIRRLEVSIPAGVRSGTKIKVSNEGKPGKNGGSNGDLYLSVKLKEHERFWLDADDVHSELTIEPQEAVLGCTKKIPTLEDIIELIIPANTYNGRVLRLRDKGLKNSHGESLGDHYVHVEIDIPKNLSTEEITTYKYLRELASKR